MSVNVLCVFLYLPTVAKNKYLVMTDINGFISFAFARMWWHLLFDNPRVLTVYYAVAYFFCDSLQTITFMPLIALMHESTRYSDERTLLTSYRMLFSCGLIYTSLRGSAPRSSLLNLIRRLLYKKTPSRNDICLMTFPIPE